MNARVDLYTSGGIVTGLLVPTGDLAERLERVAAVELDEAAWTPLHGPVARASSRIAITVDDILAANDPDAAAPPLHAVWHPVLLEMGPYRVRGELPTLPGFDPGRALTRPSGTFLRLRDVRIEITDRPDAGTQDHAGLLINRYAVDRVRAGLMLGFFFPGATIEESIDVEPVAHG